LFWRRRAATTAARAAKAQAMEHLREAGEIQERSLTVAAPSCASASQTQSVNNRFSSGKPGSPLTKKFNRSQSSSPGHFPFHTSRRGSSAWKCAQPSACQPQCGQRSMSQPARWRSPIRQPQSGQGPSFLLMLVVQKRRDAMRFAVRWSVNRSLNALFYFHTRGNVVGRGFLNVRAHLQLHRLASRRAGAERVRLIRTVSLSAGLPSRSIWPQVFAECGGLLPIAASRIWAACGIRAPTRAAPRIPTERIWT
jgi:hypothetical protein